MSSSAEITPEIGELGATDRKRLFWNGERGRTKCCLPLRAPANSHLQLQTPGTLSAWVSPLSPDSPVKQSLVLLRPCVYRREPSIEKASGFPEVIQLDNGRARMQTLTVWGQSPLLINHHATLPSVRTVRNHPLSTRQTCTEPSRVPSSRAQELQK